MDTTLLTTAPVLDLTPTDLDSIVDELHAYHAIFSPLFARREQREWAATYLHGLLLDIPRKSIEPMVLHLRGADRNAVRTLQQFIAIGAWEDGPILAQHWREIAADLGDEDGVLVVDGSDFPKQGKESVGVKRQYCGQLGKTANCQAGVFLAYASAPGYALLDRRLYLPEEWFSDAYAERRAACGVPTDVTFTTKPMLSLAMVQQVVQAGSLPCRWVAGDEAFGDNPALLDALDELGLWYFMEVAHDTRGWDERPGTVVPPLVGARPQTHQSPVGGRRPAAAQRHRSGRRVAGHGMAAVHRQGGQPGAAGGGVCVPTRHRRPRWAARPRGLAHSAAQPQRWGAEDLPRERPTRHRPTPARAHQWHALADRNLLRGGQAGTGHG